MEAVYRSYYTKSDPIVQYMVSRLHPTKGMKILEPCAGDGVFVEALCGLKKNFSVDAFDLNPAAISVLNEKFADFPNISVTHDDVLFSPDLQLLANMGGSYDRVIGNPPYGGWQDYDKRKELKQLFPNLYVRETYSLFLYHCIRLLKHDGILVFIIPDTFLNLHLHKQLRSYLLTNTKVHEIALFPSSFFPGVNFGYSNLSIITCSRSTNRDACLKNVVKVVTDFKCVDDLNDAAAEVSTHYHKQEDILANSDHALFISGDDKVIRIINDCSTRIGDIAQCVTGFYSGNDKQFLRTSLNGKSNKYSSVEDGVTCNDISKVPNILSGISSKKCFVPIVKGGAVKYYKPNHWYMDWSKQAVQHYKTDKKARFQNSTYYFQSGIGIPMVSSSSISAALLDGRLFDQSIVGVFPQQEQLTRYLLAFFNSPTCNTLIRTINPSANNPANYIKKIPFIQPDAKTVKKVNGLVDQITAGLKLGNPIPAKEEADLHSIFENLYGFKASETSVVRVRKKS